MRNFGRLFNCAHCDRQVVLCPRCDHGNIYCSQGCGEEERGQAQRLAGQRYQDSLQGRRKHAQRQQRYRQRRLDQTPENEGCGRKVTHHPLTRERRRPVVPQTPTTRRGTRPFGHERSARVFRCHRCGRFCARFVYPGQRPVRHPAREG